MRVVVTRPEHQAAATAERLAARGHAAIPAPLLAFRGHPEAIPVDRADAFAGVVLTSQNAVRALAETPRRGALLALPAFAVGAATAAAARAAGFAAVESAGGDADALARTLAARPALAGRRLLHLVGRDKATALGPLLAPARIAVEEAVAYAMEAVAAPPEGLRAAARTGADALLVYSPRTARVLAALVAADPALAPLCAVPAVAISQAAARPLADGGWRTIRVAETPSEPAMLAALAALGER